MSFETRAWAAADRLRATTAVDADAGLTRLRRTHRRRSTARAAGVGVAVAAVLLIVGPGLTGNRDAAQPAPAGPPPSTAQPPTVAEPVEPTVAEAVEPTSGGPVDATAAVPIDTTGWVGYTSDQYDVTVGHPPDWVAIPASRSWGVDDAGNPQSPAHDTFRSPSGVRVSVWEVPFELGPPVPPESGIARWVEEYCEGSSSTPCTEIAGRSVPLCLESRDCHPGLLVPFRDDVRAFFSGGIHDSAAMTVVAVWAGESAPDLAPYGGSQRLLEAFLRTLAVWPASTPFEERTCYGAPPEGLACLPSS